MSEENSTSNPDQPDQPDQPESPTPKETSGEPSPPPPAASAGKGTPAPDKKAPEPDAALLPGPASRTFGKSKKERKSFGLMGPLLFLFLLLAGGIGAGGFFMYQEQVKFQEETRAQLLQLEDKINSLDTEADLTRKNQQSIDAVKQELAQFKTQMTATVKAHQNSLSTLDEDVLRLKEKVEKVPPVPPAPEPSVLDDLGLTSPPPTQVEPAPETRDEDSGEALPEETDKRTRDTQKFMDWVKNLFGAMWDWFAGLFS